MKRQELVQLRDYCVKHFELDNGKRKCIISSGLLHYYDGNRFKEIPKLPDIKKIILNKEKSRHFLFEIPKWGTIRLSGDNTSFVVTDKKGRDIWAYQTPFVYPADKNLQDYERADFHIDKKELGAIDCEYIVGGNSVYLKLPPGLKYPLKIDPTDTSAANNKDAYLIEADPNDNNNLAYLWLSKDGVGYRNHIVMEWTLPSGSGIITDIKLYLYQYTYTAFTNEGMAAEIHELLEGPFIETEVTWNSYSSGNSWTNAGGLEPTSASATDIDTVNLSRESAVWKTWILKGTGAENPVDWSWGNTKDIVIYDPVASGDGDFYKFRSRTAASDKPYLEITYISPKSHGYIF